MAYSLQKLMCEIFSSHKSSLAKLKVVQCMSTIRNNRDSNNILNSGLTDVEIPKVSIVEFVKSKCGKYDNFIASECGETGRKYTYNDLRVKSKNLGKAFRKKLNLQENDVVAVLLPNIPEYPLVILGILEGGLVMTTLNPIYTSEEICRQLKDSSAKVLITLNELFEVANAACQLLQSTLPILTIKTKSNQSLPRGAINFAEFVDTEVDYPIIRPRRSTDIAFLPYSSGTTGLPKGVQLTHHNIISSIVQNSSPELNLLNEATENHQDVIPAVLPMFHIYGLTVTTLITLTFGCKSITLPKFTPDLYISTLKNHKPNVLFVVPPIVLFLTNHPGVKSEDLTCVKTVFSGAAPLGALDEEKFIEKAKNKDIDVLQGYGLTETSPGVSVLSAQLRREKNASGSIGRPVPNTFVKVAKVDDENGPALGPNESGELLVKGPQVMKGYHNNPEETRNIFTEDGWLKTGDMVHYNEDGILYVTDRLKELIKVKGFQVPPAELEEIIRDFPNVVDAAVIGVPHAVHGEAPRAYVVAKAGTKVDVNELRDHVAGKVADYKQLSGGVALVDSIPKNLSGKIMRRQLKLQYEKETKQ